MTREEAIKVLNGIRHLNYRNFWDEECDEAIDIAIKALSEDKTDRMTREEAIADIKNNIKPVVGGKSLDMAIEALTADVEIPSDKTVVHIETYRRLYEKYVDLKNNAVKVVKCKNCRHRFYDKYNDCYMCDRHEYGESFEDDDYCSWGERKEIGG